MAIEFLFLDMHWSTQFPTSRPIYLYLVGQAAKWWHGFPCVVQIPLPNGAGKSRFQMALKPGLSKNRVLIRAGFMK